MKTIQIDEQMGQVIERANRRAQDDFIKMHTENYKQEQAKKQQAETKPSGCAESSRPATVNQT